MLDLKYIKKGIPNKSIKSKYVTKKQSKFMKIGILKRWSRNNSQHLRTMGIGVLKKKVKERKSVRSGRRSGLFVKGRRNKFNMFRNAVFDIRRNRKYSTQLKTLFLLSKSLKIPLNSSDFKFVYYYKNLMTKKILPLRWPIYRVPMDMPQEYLAKQKYMQRKRWKILFYNKIRLVRIYHWSCMKWSMKKLFFNAPAYKSALLFFKNKLHRIRLRYVKKKKIKPVDQKKEYINQKFNKKFKLFKMHAKQKKYTHYQYQLKLLQSQFLIYLQLTPYFYKQLFIFYKQFGFYSNYEKFFYSLWHRLVIILHKLRYFSPYYVSLSIYYKVLKCGFVLVNGRRVVSIYSCVWLNDSISIGYKLYCFEWIIYRQYVLLKKRLWAATRKAFIKKTLYKPYIMKNIGRFMIYRKPWVVSSKRVPSSIIISSLGKFWQKKIFPRFYNYLNLQIVSETLLERSY
jgi:hypothetical protein